MRKNLLQILQPNGFKISLLLICFAYCLFSDAQNNSKKYTITNKVNRDNKLLRQNFLLDNYKAVNLSPKHLKKVFDNFKSGGLTSYYIGGSMNAYTLLVTQSTCLTANQNLNTIMFTYRDDHENLENLIPCDILSSFSVDQGHTWKTINITDQNLLGYRYPSGVIYNPTNNTNPLNAYSVIAGPTANGNSGWVGNYFGSTKLDSTNQNILYLPSNSNSEAFPRYGMTSCDDGRIHVLGIKDIVNYDSGDDSINFKTGVINNAVFDTASKAFSWNQVNVRPSFYKSGNTVYGNEYVYNTAWSQDGSIGYIYYFGVDSVYNHYTYYPIVFQSLDRGVTWQQLGDFDFSKLSAFTTGIAALWPTHSNSSVILPAMFGDEVDGTVDANGNLHIFTLVQGSYADNIDSIGYIYATNNADPNDPSRKVAAEPQKIFDVYTQQNGTWGAQFVDYIYSYTVETTESILGSGNNAVGWDHRLQAGRTQDGTKIFASWTDTDTSNSVDNLFPNLIVYGKDINTGLRTVCKNFTENTAFDSGIMFDYIGNIVLSNSGTYTIPVTYATFNMAYDPTDTTYHHYLAGVTFTDNDFITNPGIKELSNNNFMNVSQNYPNPFTGTTNITISLTKPANISLEVRNLLGQKVFEIPAKNLQAGLNTLTIRGNNLQSGIYFYSVITVDQVITKKMMVK